LLSLTALLAAEGKADNPPKPPSLDTKPDESGKSRMTMPPPPDEVGGRSLESWMRDLTADDASTRTNAIVNIVAFRENAAPAITALLGRFHDGDVSPRVKAVIAFRFLPEIPQNRTAQVVKALAQVLRSDYESTVRYEAAVTLDRFRGKNKAAVPELIANSRNRSSWEIRYACLTTLLYAGFDPEKGPDPAVTHALLDATRDSTHKVRLQAIMNLGFMGRPPDPHLLEEVAGTLHMWARSNTAHRTTRLWANVSLILLGDKLKEKSLDAIAKNLTAKESEIKIESINALGVLTEKARDKVPDLVNMLSDSDDAVVVAATDALTMLNDKGQRVLLPIINLTKLNKDHAAVIVHACSALNRIGVADPGVVKALEDVNRRESLPKELRLYADAALKDLLKPKPKDDDKPKPREVPKDNDRPAIDQPVRRGGR
jgi:HEAT repeat protein